MSDLDTRDNPTGFPPRTPRDRFRIDQARKDGILYDIKSAKTTLKTGVLSDDEVTKLNNWKEWLMTAMRDYEELLIINPEYVEKITRKEAHKIWLVVYHLRRKVIKVQCKDEKKKKAIKEKEEKEREKEEKRRRKAEGH